MLTTEFFVREFRNVETEELLRRAVTRDLTDEAKAAIIEVLRERNVDIQQLPQLLQQAKKDVLRETGVTNQCDFCGKTILSKIVDGDQKFCSSSCRITARALEATLDTPKEEIVQHAGEIRNGPCPICRKTNPPIELHQEYTIVSAVFVTLTTRNAFVSCNECKKKRALKAIVFCLVLGWWSPKGLFLNVRQIYRNFQTILAKEGTTSSPGLIGYAQIDLGKKLAGIKG